MRENLVRRPFAVQQEGAAFFQNFDHIVAADVSRNVARNEVGSRYQPRHIDRAFSKTQVRGGDSAGLFGVVNEIRLSVHIGIVSDDFDAVFVGTDRSVGSEPPKHTAGDVGGSYVDFVFDFQRPECDVVIDADCKTVEAFAVKVFENRFDVGRFEFLGAQTVTAADYLDSGAGQSGLNVQKERFAERAGFFGSVQNSDFFYCFRQHIFQCFDAERAVKAYFDSADFFSAGQQIIDRQFDGIAGASHRDNDFFGVFRSDIIEEVVLPTGQCGNFVHVFLNDCRNFVIHFIGCFAALKINVAVLGGNAQCRRFRLQRSVFKAADVLRFDQRFDVVIGNFFDFLNFMRGAESVKKT